MSSVNLVVLSVVLSFFTALSQATEFSEKWEVLDSKARALYHEGKYVRALIVAQDAHDLAESETGLWSDSMAVSLNLLGNIYRKQEKYDKAERALKHHLVIFSKKFGRSHPYTMRSLDDLARIHALKGDYDSAEKYFKRVLMVREVAQEVGDESIEVSFLNLAQMYFLKKDYEESKTFYQKLLKFRQDKYGDGHDKVFAVINELAELHYLINPESASAAGSRILSKTTEQTLAINGIPGATYVRKKYSKKGWDSHMGLQPRSSEVLTKLYNRSCRICHDTGSAGAPVRDDIATWQKRLAVRPQQEMVENTLKGYGGMPPKGLCMNCTASQIEQLVGYLLGALAEDE